MTSVAKVAAVALQGLDGSLVTVEGATGRQLPGMAIIGLPDTALAEAKQRVRHAAAAVGCSLTDRFVLINLQPADLPKQGSGFDLAIALAALGALGAVPAKKLSRVVHLGELSLAGELRRPRALLAAVVAAVKMGCNTVMVPAESAAEAALVPGARIIAAHNLRGAINWHLGKHEGWEYVEKIASGTVTEAATLDITDVVGQTEAVEALEIAAAGRHHIHMQGPPGAGKTMLAARLPSILPQLSDEEAVTVSSLATLSKVLPLRELIRVPPFESPHHTASMPAIIGSAQGGVIKPGSVSLASFGVLFFDEAQEFPAAVLDSLRQPLESGWVDIHRAAIKTRLPAKVQLVLASNPCPCGLGGSVKTAAMCVCTPQQLRRYSQKISGPLLDRIDVRLKIQRVTNAQKDVGAEIRSSESIRERIIVARETAAARLRGTAWSVNAEVPGMLLRGKKLHPGKNATAVLDRALEIGKITLRGYDRTLRIAWSISDLNGKTSPGREEIAQALLLREGGNAR